MKNNGAFIKLSELWKMNNEFTICKYFNTSKNVVVNVEKVLKHFVVKFIFKSAKKHYIKCFGNGKTFTVKFIKVNNPL